jgi:type I restriction enzyme, S subunit
MNSHSDKNTKQPKLRFPGFKGEWQKKRLGDVAEIIGGGTPDTKKEEYWNGHINWFTPTEIKDKYIYHSLRKISESGLKNSSAKLLPIGTILFTSRATIGDAGFAMQECCTNQGFQSFVVKDKYNKEFIYYWICNNKNEFITKANGSTFLEISKNQITQIPLPLPTLPEQKKIAEFLSDIDTKIEKLIRKKELTEKYKKGAMQKIFSQKIRFKDENGKNYPNWEEKRLGDVAEKSSSNISANTLEESNGHYPVYGATGYIKGIDFYREEKDYISIVKDGAGAGRILFCEGKSSVLGTLDVIQCKAKNCLQFLYYLLLQIDFKVFITGSTIPHIYFKDYSKEKMNIPCLEEQKEIADFLTNIDKTVEQIERELAMLKEYKKGLLQGMFV